MRYGGTNQLLVSSPKSITCGAQPSYQGYFDVATCGYIAGWAWDPNNYYGHVNVRIVADNTTQIGYISATGYRQDLQQAGVGDGTHAWQMATPQSLEDGNPHSITVYFEYSGTTLVNSPRTIQCGSFPVNGGGSTIGGYNGNVIGGSSGSCFNARPTGESRITVLDSENIHTYSSTRIPGTGGYLWTNSLTNVALRVNGANVPGSPTDYTGYPTTGADEEQVPFNVYLPAQGYGTYTQSAHHRWTSASCQPYYNPYTYPPQGDTSISATLTAPPVVNSVTPSAIAIGMDTSVVIDGTGFGSTPSVEVDSGASVSIQSGSDTRIYATITVPGNAADDSTINLTVVAMNRRSNTIAVIARLPYRVAFVGDISQERPACDPGQTGYQRNVTLQVVNSRGEFVGVNTVNDFINFGTKNDLGLPSRGYGPFTAVLPFYDSYFACSTACYPNPAAAVGESDALQTWQSSLGGLGSLPIVYKCNSITIDGH